MTPETITSNGRRRADEDIDVVQLRNLGISYRTGKREVAVLKGITLTLEKGRILGLVGESGSGKSTLASALLGSLRTGSFVSTGTASVSGQDVFALRAKELRRFRISEVAMVPQNAGSALTPTMKIHEQIAEALHSLKGNKTAQRSRAEELLRLVRLPNPAQALDRYPHQFSGGQQQRIGIAVALAANPTLLVLDEPTTGLDVVTQAAILDLLSGLQGSLGMSMVMVSHDLGVIEKMCTDVAVLRRGEIVEAGATREVLANPKHPYTRGLVASVPRIDVPGIPPSMDQDAIDAGEDWVPDQEVYRRIAPQGAVPVLSVESLSIDYRRKHIPGTGATVQDVSFTVNAGEVVALVGESGSGKSSIANAIAGLQKTAGGRITLADGGAGGGELAKTVTGRPKNLRQAIQLIFQNADTSLNPRQSVHTAIQRPINLFSVKNASVPQALADVDLPASYAQRLPGQLSGGQRQRVGIARAVAAAPSLVLADEVVSALDVSVQSSILRLMDELSREKSLGFLFITHDLAVVRAIADRVVVLYLGRVVEEGTVEEIFASISHPYSRLLLDSVIELGDDHDAKRKAVKDEIPAAPPEVGCPFASRCPLVRDVCHTVAPPTIAVSATHNIKCHADVAELTGVSAEVLEGTRTC
ncbi:ABC transporter ATP-binding protein [Arthrobacter sp. ISL-5]|uniref:dipeptide ABC transporter ATP-binding protein n=1 Tax=Arthrobacter sp. ISL-5 TaxID=2819111 RepID=UPI001BE8C92C|nr:ABC transporter ATP-binding protein [Arthrobacter sp. ISL-5]MBT2554507.1 ABC transporter ATP-binding protein [Arthrobacter sp. ISL-5]